MRIMLCIYMCRSCVTGQPPHCQQYLSYHRLPSNGIFFYSFPDIESRVQDGFQVVNCECTVAMQPTPKGDIND